MVRAFYVVLTRQLTKASKMQMKKSLCEGGNQATFKPTFLDRFARPVFHNIILKALTVG